MSGSLASGGGENVPDIPGACAPEIFRIWQEAHVGEFGIPWWTGYLKPREMVSDVLWFRMAHICHAAIDTCSHFCGRTGVINWLALESYGFLFQNVEHFIIVTSEIDNNIIGIIFAQLIYHVSANKLYDTSRNIILDWCTPYQHLPWWTLK